MVRPINLSENEIFDTLVMPGTEIDLDFLQEKSWLSSYYLDFKKRLLNLLGFEFRSMSCSLGF